MSADQTQNTVPGGLERIPSIVHHEPTGKPSVEQPAEKNAPEETLTPEKMYTPEAKAESEFTPTVDSENFLDEAIGSLKEKLRSKKKHVKPIPLVKDQVTVQIEHIMEEGLEDAYRELTPVQQQQFKIKGEETAIKIRQLIKHGKVKIKVIFKLLIEWLVMLPGVNRFFAEQEAKIKADKIIETNQK